VKGVYADFLRKRIEELGLTHAEMGQLLGVTARQIRYYLVGKSNITDDKLERLKTLTIKDDKTISSAVSSGVSPSISQPFHQHFTPDSKGENSKHDAVSVCNKEVKNSIKDIKEDNVTRNDVTAKRKKSTICSLEKKVNI